MAFCIYIPEINKVYSCVCVQSSECLERVEVIVRHLEEADTYGVDDNDCVCWSVGEHVDKRVVCHG